MDDFGIEILTSNFTIVDQTKHFRACSATRLVGWDNGKPVSFSYLLLIDSIAIEQKADNECYCVIAFLRWKKEEKKAIIEPVGERFKEAKKNVLKRIELEKCINKAKERIYAENEESE